MGKRIKKKHTTNENKHYSKMFTKEEIAYIKNFLKEKIKFIKVWTRRHPIVIPFQDIEYVEDADDYGLYREYEIYLGDIKKDRRVNPITSLELYSKFIGEEKLSDIEKSIYEKCKENRLKERGYIEL